MSDCLISTDQHLLDLDLIHEFLREAYWAKGRTRAVNDRAIENSLCFGAYVDDRQVGFARVITDRAVFAWLADVFVLPGERGQGVGQQLVGAVVAHADLQGLRRFMLATSDASELYRGFGFESINGEQASILMQLFDQSLPRVD